MPLARQEDAAPPRGLQLGMQQLALKDGEEEEDDDADAPLEGLTPCFWCDLFAVAEDGFCLYCGRENFPYEEESDEACSEPKEQSAPPSAGPTTFCGLKKSFLCKSTAPPPPASSSQDCSVLSFALPQKQQLTAEEAERNAEELVAEEERAKKKAEKKRLKKKRQKDRKRQERRDQELEARSHAQPAASSDRKEGVPLADVPSVVRPASSESAGGSSQGPSKNLPSPGCTTEEEDELEEELDLTSTFVSKARLKVSTRPPILRKEKMEKEKSARPESSEQQEVPRPALEKTPAEQSLVLADCGNETAKRGCYWEAVLLFTEAVKLNPREYRLFGNRSFCYERLQRYPEALRDAQLALRLQPGWPKGLFRQGKALMGLKQYAEAARTFEELLKVDGFQGDAATQLQRCRVQLLLQESFVPPAVSGSPGWSTLAPGTQLPWSEGQTLLSCTPEGGQPLASFTIAHSKCSTVLPSAAPAPVREWFAVWVGNLTPKVTQDVLLRHFQPFGPIDSIRCLPQKFCAFVNYIHREAAEAAFLALQGVDVEGRKLQLQLKHPVHATPPAAKTASSRRQEPLNREPAGPPSAWGCSFGRLPQRRAVATKLLQR